MRKNVVLAAVCGAALLFSSLAPTADARPGRGRGWRGNRGYYGNSYYSPYYGGYGSGYYGGSYYRPYYGGYGNYGSYGSYNRPYYGGYSSYYGPSYGGYGYGSPYYGGYGGYNGFVNTPWFSMGW